MSEQRVFCLLLRDEALREFYVKDLAHSPQESVDFMRSIYPSCNVVSVFESTYEWS